VTGEVLLNADHEMLKELKVKTVGHRLAILKALNKLKLAQGYEDEDPNDTDICKLCHQLKIFNMCEVEKQLASSQLSPGSDETTQSLVRMNQIIKERGMSKSAGQRIMTDG
jgi:hypothetical protein